MRVLNDEEIKVVENIYRAQVTKDSEWFNNPARQLQLMSMAYRKGKQSQFRADITGFVEWLEEHNVYKYENALSLTTEDWQTLKQLVEG